MCPTVMGEEEVEPPEAHLCIICVCMCACRRNRSVCLHVCVFIVKPLTCVSICPNKGRRKEGKREKIAASGRIGCLPFLLPLAFPFCHISWKLFSQLLLLSARKLTHTPLFHRGGRVTVGREREREQGREETRRWGGKGAAAPLL